VNAGPLALAEAFLGEKASQYQPRDVRALKAAFSSLLSACHDAVQINSQFCPPEQVRGCVQAAEVGWTLIFCDAQYAYRDDLKSKFGMLQERLQFLIRKCAHVCVFRQVQC
jgi:hypothetical protein